MTLALDPFRLVLISLAGWMNQRQQDVIDFLQEENRVLREQLGGKRLHFNDDQRRRLAVSPRRAVRLSGSWSGVSYCCSHRLHRRVTTYAFAEAC